MQYRRTIHRIMDTYNQMTQVERTVADFFLNNTKPVDLASKNLAKIALRVRGHSSRFARSAVTKDTGNSAMNTNGNWAAAKVNLRPLPQIPRWRVSTVF